MLRKFPRERCDSLRILRVSRVTARIAVALTPLVAATRIVQTASRVSRGVLAPTRARRREI